MEFCCFFWSFARLYSIDVFTYCCCYCFEFQTKSFHATKLRI